MEINQHNKTSYNLLRKYIWVFALIWTLIIVILFLADLKQIKQHNLKLVKNEAMANYNKDLAFRFWAASHGGVYVPITEKTPPNPFLSHIPNRDIVTAAGEKLTLMNPAYMLRQMIGFHEQLYGIKGHITALKYFRPETAPDEWETQTLKLFEKGIKEKSEISKSDGKTYFKFMSPIKVKEGCLKCHGHQGYKVGDIRGGLSVSVPMEKYTASMNVVIVFHLFSFLFLWALGMAGILFSKFKLAKNLKEQDKSHASIKASIKEKDVLLREIHHRVKNNMQVIISLLKLQSKKISNENDKGMFLEGQNRIEAMSLVHETLYKSENISSIIICDYIKKIVNNLATVYNSNKISLDLNCTGSEVQLSIDKATPVGLLTNELITNVYKHAYPGPKTGVLKIELNKDENDNIEMKFSDNGVGLPDGLDISTTDSLGLWLVYHTVTQQLGGEITTSIDNGTKYLIKFSTKNK